VRGLLIQQSLKANLPVQLTTLIESDSVYSVKDDKEHFWGIGPELGLEADWYMGWNWSLYASFDVVSYYGRVCCITSLTCPSPSPSPRSDEFR